VAIISDVFSHSTPTTFDFEAPTHSSNIGERILDRGFEVVDAILRAKYGDRSGLPLGQTNSTAAQRAQQQLLANAGGDSSGIGIFLLIGALLFLFLSKR